MDMLQSSEEVAGKREQNRIRNRGAILHAARECFRERGYENSTIRDIVRRTGLAAGTFYNYFSSKQEILSTTPIWHFSPRLPGIRWSMSWHTAMIARFGSCSVRTFSV